MTEPSPAKQPSVSIVVPVYNVAQYLVQCLESLVNQTLKDIEIIIVDDGSTDESGKICDRYAAQYPFIRLIHQNNAGLSAARKSGMAGVTGEYCGFCDSDDFVSPDFFEDLYLTAKKSNADIVQGGYTMYYSDHEQTAYIDARTNAAIKNNNGNADKLRDVMLLCPSLIWRRIHKTSLLKKYNIEFDPSIRMAEDLHFSNQTILTANSFATADNAGYFYRQNREGRLTFVGDVRMLDLYWQFDKLDKFITSNNLKKVWAVNHLAVNIPLHQIYRVDENLRNQYMDELLKRLTLKYWFMYVVSGIKFSLKMKFIKYFILTMICAHTLLVVSVFRRIKPMAHTMLKFTLFFRKGEFVRSFIKNFSKIPFLKTIM